MVASPRWDVSEIVDGPQQLYDFAPQSHSALTHETSQAPWLSGQPIRVPARTNQRAMAFKQLCLPVAVQA